MWGLGFRNLGIRGTLKGSNIQVQYESFPVHMYTYIYIYTHIYSYVHVHIHKDMYKDMSPTYTESPKTHTAKTTTHLTRIKTVKRMSLNLREGRFLQPAALLAP